MVSKHVRGRTAITVFVLAAGTVLSGCGSSPQAGDTASAGGSAASTVQGSPAPAAPPPPASATAPAVMPTAPGVDTAAPALKVFTFPDGHITFSYPEAWSVALQRGPGRDDGTFRPFEAIVSDTAGDDLVRISSGADGIGCTSGPTHRTVLDTAAVPAMRDGEGTVPQFAFAVENTGGRDWYTMALSHPRYVEEGETSSGCALLNLPNGGSQAMVIFSQPSQAPFLSRESAQAWTTTEQYGQLKSLLLSLSYS